MDLDDLIGMGEREMHRQRRAAIFFEELAIPAAIAHEAHQHAVARYPLDGSLVTEVCAAAHWETIKQRAVEERTKSESFDIRDNSYAVTELGAQGVVYSQPLTELDGMRTDLGSDPSQNRPRFIRTPLRRQLSR